MIHGCSCPVPTFHSVHANTCGRCRKILDPSIVDSDENLAEFRGYLEPIPQFPVAALEHAYRRLDAGRREFGLEYLSRNNPAEGQQEQADSLNYAFFDWLCQRREGIDEIDPDLLDAAHHSALAHEAFERVRRKRGDRRRPEDL